MERGILDGHDGFRPALQLMGISLTYPGSETPAIADTSLSVQPGESLALVGSTGAGKSTIADVILGVLVPDTGSVTLGGVAPTVAAQRWPGAIAYVPQEITVLDGSIRENVALGLPQEIVDDSLVWEALERAHLAATVRDERDGLDTVVGENGVRLSGGQRQRLGLARALYTRPRLIVLDEATSSLDAETERAVSSALGELEGDVTLVIVAHRLATIRHCTSVAYIEQGVLRAQGTFEEVRAREPNFDRQAELLGL
jgi:ABC-type multidrug transport system fused ATPase/permease subunit